MNDSWGGICKLKIAIHAPAVAVIRSACSTGPVHTSRKTAPGRNLQHAATGEMASCLTPPIIF
jgi:hypothetical protein